MRHGKTGSCHSHYGTTYEAGAKVGMVRAWPFLQWTSTAYATARAARYPSAFSPSMRTCTPASGPWKDVTGQQSGGRDQGIGVQAEKGQGRGLQLGPRAAHPFQLTKKASGRSSEGFAWLTRYSSCVLFRVKL